MNLVITLSRNQLGLWSIPGLIAPDPTSVKVLLDGTILPKVSRRIVFGRGSGVKHLAYAPDKPPSRVLAVVGASSSKSKRIQEALKTISQTTSNVHIFQVQGRADHEAIHGGIRALHGIEANHVIAMGGGTTLDVGKAIAGLASPCIGAFLQDIRHVPWPHGGDLACTGTPGPSTSQPCDCRQAEKSGKSACEIR